MSGTITSEVRLRAAELLENYAELLKAQHHADGKWRSDESAQRAHDEANECWALACNLRPSIQTQKRIAKLRELSETNHKPGTDQLLQEPS